jgi:exopolysaccharide biosynthesis polyprenyl glycosylphosphotransferase
MHPPGKARKFGYMILDAALVASSISVAFVMKFQESGSPENLLHVYVIPASILLRIIFYSHFRLYDLSKQETSLVQLYYLFWAGLAASGVEWLLLLIMKSYYLKESAGVSREIILNSWAMIFMSTAFWRLYYRFARRRLGEHIHRVAIIGAGPRAVQIRKEARQLANFDLEVSGFITTGSACEEAASRVLGGLDDLREIVRDQKLDEIIIALESSERESLLGLIALCEDIPNPPAIRILPDPLELYLGRVELTQLAGLPLVEPPEQWRGGIHLIAKRTMDILLSLPALILFLPFGFVIALFILMEGMIRPHTRGPVFFVQSRVGRNRKDFRLIKFRTMIRTAEDGCGPLMAAARDPRITWMGQFLRRTGMDELPQLWNILKGEMSLVGPRPERPEFVERFIEEYPPYALRFRLRPGLTGLAQIHGHYDSSVNSKIRYDLVYLANLSLLLDIKILGKTLQVIMTGHKRK